MANKVIYKELQGCAKLKYDNLLKCVQKNFIDEQGVTHPGASKYEILTLIFLLQIADSSGTVSQFKTSDLADIIQCDKRTVFAILKSLSKKGFINKNYFNDKNWSGVHNIVILNNDFSNVTKYTPNDRYISVFYPCFDFSNPATIKKINELSLYALRLLLILLSMYEQKRGIRVSFSRLCGYLCINERSLIEGYMHELELTGLFGSNFYHIEKLKKNRIINGFVLVHSYNYELTPQKSPREKQLSFYKRKWMLFFQNECEYVSDAMPMYKYLNYLFSIIYEYLNKKIRLSDVEQSIKASLSLDEFSIDMLSLYRASASLEKLIT